MRTKTIPRYHRGTSNRTKMRFSIYRSVAKISCFRFDGVPKCIAVLTAVPQSTAHFTAVFTKYYYTAMSRTKINATKVARYCDVYQNSFYCAVLSRYRGIVLVRTLYILIFLPSKTFHHFTIHYNFA